MVVHSDFCFISLKGFLGIMVRLWSFRTQDDSYPAVWTFRTQSLDDSYPRAGCFVSKGWSFRTHCCFVVVFFCLFYYILFIFIYLFLFFFKFSVSVFVFSHPKL